METWQIEGLDRLERSGYLSALRQLARSHTCSIWWWDDNSARTPAILHNGTMSFVNTGSSTLGITAYHVYQQYISDRQNNSAIKCQVGNVTVELEKYLVSGDRDLDMAVFELSPVLLGATGAIVHSTRRWPPANLQASDLVIVAGYPGERRRERPTTVQHDFLSFIGRVSQSSDDHASVYLNLSESHWPQGVKIEAQLDLGGMSGGPAYRLVTEPIETIEMVGLVYEANKAYELVFTRHLSFVAANGELRVGA